MTDISRHRPDVENAQARDDGAFCNVLCHITRRKPSDDAWLARDMTGDDGHDSAIGQGCVEVLHGSGAAQDRAFCVAVNARGEALRSLHPKIEILHLLFFFNRQSPYLGSVQIAVGIVAVVIG